MSIIVNVKSEEFEGFWSDRKTFYILTDKENKHEINSWDVLSLRERDSRGKLTGREINANITHYETIPPHYKILGIFIYQKVDFVENRKAKRRI